jgi:tetratricopeptide (TPR) repeat protein
MNLRPLLPLFFFVLLLGCASSKKSDAPTAAAKPKAKVLTEGERMEIDYLFFNAQKEKLIGNMGVAENLFVEILKRDETNAQAHYEIGRTSMARQELPRALQYAQKASKLDPSNPWYLRLEADLLRQSGRQQEAIPVLRKLAQLPGQEKVDVLMDIALLHGEVNQYPEAIKALNEVEKIGGPAPELAEQKRQYYTKMGKPDKALEEIKRLSAAYPTQPEYMLYLGQLYFEKGDFLNAQKQFETALQYDPTNGKIFVALADTYRAQKQNKKAEEFLSKAFDYPDVDIDLKIQVMLTLFAQFDKDPGVRALALELSRKTTVLHAEEAKAWAIRADFLYHSQQFEEAVKAYRQAIELDTESQKYTVWQQYLLSLLEVQQWAELSKQGTRATELFPNQPVPYFLGGLALLQEKQHQQAIDILRRGVRMVYGNAELEAQFYAALGDGYHSLSKHEESDASYDRALKIKPNNALVLNNYAYYLSLRKQQLDKAAEMSARSLKLEPGNPSYLDTYGWILYQQGKYSEARKYIEQALAASGENGTLLDHLGDVVFKMGETDKALAYWLRAKAAGVESEFIDRKIADKQLYE